MSRVGIMQGRLLPPEAGRIQSFPAHRWNEEFANAREAGLCSIEWIYETGTDELNPLRNDAGIQKMKQLALETGVEVRSICADYYMSARLISGKGEQVSTEVDHLNWLIGQAGKLGVVYMVLPFVDSSSLPSEREVDALVEMLKTVSKCADENSVELHLETDFVPSKLADILRRIDHPMIRANYDIGNSASLGQRFEEIDLIAPWLGSVHVKDRVLNGGTVALGTGDADFDTAFEKIENAGYDRPYILQVARADDVSEVQHAIRNRNFVENHLRKLAE